MTRLPILSMLFLLAPASASAQSFDAVYGFPGVFPTLEHQVMKVHFDLSPSQTFTNDDGMWGDWDQANGVHTLWFYDEQSATTPAPLTPPGAATWQGSFAPDGSVCDGTITTADDQPGLWKSADCPIEADIVVEVGAQGGQRLTATIAEHLIPGTPVALIVGNGTPGGAVERCPELALDLGAPRVLAQAIADESGRAVLQRKIPAGMAGRTVYLQAVDMLACSATPVQSQAL